MTIENDILREQVLALMKSPQLELPDYSADPIVVRRVGKMFPRPRRVYVSNCLQMKIIGVSLDPRLRGFRTLYEEDHRQRLRAQASMTERWSRSRL
jgi:hypothetical protein